MDPILNAPPPAPESPAAPAPQPTATADATPSPTFSQAQVDAMVATAAQNAHNAAYAQARRTFEGRAPGS